MQRVSRFLVGILLSLSFSSIAFAIGEGSRIDMGISPIRDEFTVNQGATVKRTVKFYNNASTPSLVYITAEDCVQGENYGTPKCRSYAGTGGADPDNASTWIKIEGADRFTVPAKSEKVVTYTVSAPTTATPGGHYGAVFFNNPGQGSTGNSVDMVRRIGMLYLINVPGNIVVDTELGDILIDIPNLNSAPNILDRLRKNIGDTSAWTDIMNELNPFWEKPVLSKTNLQISLNIPVQNLGNIHIKPTGKIYIYDGGEMLKKIGKESILNENGVYIGEKIVDYLPINDEQGNVLPDSERVFRIDWMGFASQELGNDGASVISFESPSDYFARVSEDNAQFIYPWEKLAVRNASKSLTAKVEFSYKNPKTGVNEISTLELPITISYNYIAKTLNWGVIIIVVLIALLAWMIIRKRNVQIEELEDELDDEIAALEKAQKTLLANKKSKVTTASSVKTPSKKVLTTKKPEAKKAPVKTVSSEAKKPVASAAKKPLVKEKPAPSTKKATPSPKAKSTTSSSATPKKPVAKKPATTKKAPPKKAE